MSKKRTTKFSSNSTEDRAYRELANFKLRDLKMACVLRGMPFDDVINFDAPKLSNWFIKNYERSQDQSLLTQYDSHVDGILEQRGYKKGDVIMSPALKYGTVVDIDTIDKPRELKPNKPIPKEKVKAIKDEVTGVRSGTKKATTFNCAYEGKSIEDTIKIVQDKFPEADPKSIKIWYKKAIKQKS